MAFDEYEKKRCNSLNFQIINLLLSSKLKLLKGTRTYKFVTELYIDVSVHMMKVMIKLEAEKGKFL